MVDSVFCFILENDCVLLEFGSFIGSTAFRVDLLLKKIR